MASRTAGEARLYCFLASQRPQVARVSGETRATHVLPLYRPGVNWRWRFIAVKRRLPL